MFFSAVAFGSALVYAVLNSDGLVQIVASWPGLAGAVCLWCGWAIWWSRRQHEFGVNPKSYPN